MRLGQLHINGRFVRGGECSCVFRVESSRGLDVEAVASLVSAWVRLKLYTTPTLIQHSLSIQIPLDESLLRTFVAWTTLVRPGNLSLHGHSAG